MEAKFCVAGFDGTSLVMCICVIFYTHTHKQGEMYDRSPSIFLTCVQYMRIFMDHKGVCIQALTGCSSAGKHFSVVFCLFFFFWTCENS